MKLAFKNGITSVMLRVKILDTQSTTGGGKTGLTFSSSGLIISTIADNESAATAYTAAGSTIETITTLGTYAAPTATKCRFKEVDATNHPGLYEIQIADARWAVSNARSVIVTVSGPTGVAQTDAEIQLENVPANVQQLAGSTTAATLLKNTMLAAASGTVQSDAGNTATSFKIDSTLGAKAADYFGDASGGVVLAFINGTTNEYQARRVSAFNTTTDFVTLESALSAAPTAGDTFVLLGRIEI